MNDDNIFLNMYDFRWANAVGCFEKKKFSLLDQNHNHHHYHNLHHHHHITTLFFLFLLEAAVAVCSVL
jgi:hypothetical protein